MTTGYAGLLLRAVREHVGVPLCAMGAGFARVRHRPPALTRSTWPGRFQSAYLRVEQRQAAGPDSSPETISAPAAVVELREDVRWLRRVVGHCYGPQVGFLFGPYASHMTALANVARGRRLAPQAVPDQAACASFGTTSYPALSRRSSGGDR